MSGAPFMVRRTCPECPWRRDVPPGRFPPERFRALADTCKPGGLRPMFACHLSPEGAERACAGFVLVAGPDANSVRLAAARGRFRPGEVSTDAPLFGSYREMAEANGVAPDDPALEGLP